jgi:NAD(P)-dependent dehydrogenase (short-subunit alcohol dehydrogenase family)
MRNHQEGPDTRTLLELFDISDQVVVVMGADAGICRDIALFFAKNGARLVIAGTNRSELKATLTAIREVGGAAQSALINAFTKIQIDNVAALAVTQYGRIDIWINSPGTPFAGSILSIKERETESLVSSTLMGALWGCIAAGNTMKDRGSGVIINLVSITGLVPTRGFTLYGLASAAVKHLTESCAQELGQFGVRVNAIMPGYLDHQENGKLHHQSDDIVGKLLGNAMRSALAASAPLQTVGTTADIFLALMYLCSASSRMVTGQLLQVNGGLTI